MMLSARMKRQARRVLRVLRLRPGRPGEDGHFFDADEVQSVCDTYFREGAAPGGPWDRLRHSHMRLPSWFRQGLDPWGEDYAQQQHRLWQLISGVSRSYEVAVDEKEHDWGEIDAVRTPGYFVRRDPYAIEAASDHVLATGMFLKHCGLKPGDSALEYGAGFAQTALALARLGVRVDTVDISTTFCEYVRRQAEFFQVPLTPFHGPFGLNPRPGHRYDLIFFYESFHHCVDFQPVVAGLQDKLAPGGRIILGGEPIVDREYAAVPYPWGVRLHSEVVAVVRRLHWFELGFSEDFLFELFSAAGFVGRRVDCAPSLFGRLHIFERRPDELHLGRHWLPTVLAEQWHAPSEDGRWTGLSSSLPVDTSPSLEALEIDLANPRPHRQRVKIVHGDQTEDVVLSPWQRCTVRLASGAGARKIVFSCNHSLSTLIDRIGHLRRSARGVFVRRLRYINRAPSEAAVPHPAPAHEPL